MDAPKKITYRVVDEFEFEYLLQNRFFTQYIAAIQPYFGGYPLKGSGWFEHRVWRDDNQKEQHMTFEMVTPPLQPEYLDLNKFITNVNNVIEMGPDSSAYPGNDPEEPRKVYITESQHDYLKPITTKLLRYMRAYCHSNIVDATFLFGFNSTWAPFLIGIRNVQLRDVPQSVQLMRTKMFSTFDNMFTRENQVPLSNVKGVTDAPSTDKTTAHDHKPPNVKKISRYDSMDVIPSFNYGVSTEPEPEPEISGDPTDPENIPKPSTLARQGGPAANVDFSKREEVPTSVSGSKLANSLPSGTVIATTGGISGNNATGTPPSATNNLPVVSKPDPRAVGAGVNPILDQSGTGDAAPGSMLQDYALAYGIGYRTQNSNFDMQREERQKMSLQNKLKDFYSEREKGTISKAAISLKSQNKYGCAGTVKNNRYSDLTETWSRRVKAYPSMVRGSQDETWDEFRRSLRPLSAAPSSGQKILAKSKSGCVKK